MNTELPGRKITLENAKAYATRENLHKALVKYGLDRHDHVECKTPENKWTAVFLSQRAIAKGECYLAFAAQYGFYTV